MDMELTNRYRPMIRPASMVSLPVGIKWEFVEAPHDIAHMRQDLPVSANRHGVIATDRPLTMEEREQFSLKVAI
jgi:hypothetical protein